MKLKSLGLFLAMLVLSAMAYAREDISTGYYFTDQEPDYFYCVPKVGLSNSFNSWNIFPSFPIKSKYSRFTPVAAIDFGYKFTGVPLKVELEYNYTQTKKYTWTPALVLFPDKSGTFSMSTQALILSGRIDTSTWDYFDPYFSLGMGYGRKSATFTYPDPYNPSQRNDQKAGGDENVLVVKATLGAGISMNQNISWIVEMNYFYWPGATVEYTVGTANPAILNFAKTKCFHNFDFMTGVSFHL